MTMDPETLARHNANRAVLQAIRDGLTEKWAAQDRALADARATELERIDAGLAAHDAMMGITSATESVAPPAEPQTNAPEPAQAAAQTSPPETIDEA